VSRASANHGLPEIFVKAALLNPTLDTRKLTELHNVIGASFNVSCIPMSGASQVM